jgi:subtilisin
MSIFDELRKLLTPARLLHDPQATGAGVRVAILDSGADQALLASRHPRMKPLQGGIFLANQPRPLPYLGQQSGPHGTTVADIVLSLAPEIELYVADIFGPAGSCEVDVVIKALAWAVDVWKCQIVNLSLGVVEQRLGQLPKRQQFLRAIEDAYFKDVLIVAAAHNDHPFTKSYPALFAPPLLSVDKFLFPEPTQFAYRLNDRIEFQAHGRGAVGPFANEPATSWAAPHLAALAARILSLKSDLKPFEVKTLLYWLATNAPPGANPLHEPDALARDSVADASG